MKNRLRLIWAKFSYFVLRPICGAPALSMQTDIYASKMLTEFNRLHRLIFPRFFSKMRVDQDSLNAVKDVLDEAIPIYVTTYVGQLEYNFFNYLFLKELLPLASYANDLSNWQWMTFQNLKKTVITRLKARISGGGAIPHPIGSGYVKSLIKEGKSVFVRLKTTSIYDDLFWDVPEEDLLQVLISAQQEIETPMKLIPQQFLWAKRPKGRRRTLVDWIFGERENPGRLRKIFLFWRNYKRHALVQFGEPLNLQDFLEAHPGIPQEELARILRNTLLSQIRQERKSITGPALKPKRWIIENVTESENVQKQIYQVAMEKNKSPDEVKLLAIRYIKEIAADISYSYIEFGNRILNRVFTGMYDGIQTNQEGLANIKKIAQRSPIVFVPNHRSHVDYLLLGNLLYSNDIAVPHVAAGINLAFWPMGTIFRHCGAFFLRRTFSGNALYKAVFESYLNLLVQEGYCQEFFIEGGRSRTGKLIQPKMGMLSMLTQAMLGNASKDLYFVPTAVTYDKVVEEHVYIDESSGKTKQKEKFTDILKLRKYRKHRYGKIYVNFGEPISFAEIKEKSGNNLDIDAKKIKIVEILAFEIMNSLNKSMVVTPSALVAAALLMESRRGVTSKRLYENIDLLRGYLEYMGVQLSDTLVAEPNRSVKDLLHQLAAHKTIEPHQDFDPIYYAVPDEKRHSLDFQKNGMIHFMLPVAYAATAMLSLLKKGAAEFERDHLTHPIDFLRKFFREEFTAVSGIVNHATIERSLSFLSERDIIDFNHETGKIILTTVGTEQLKRYKALIDNFIDAYKIALYTCSHLSADSIVTEKNLIKSMFQNGQHLLLLGKINHPEAVSQPLFANALKLLKAKGLIVEEVQDKQTKESFKYRWTGDIRILNDLQQELELLS